MIDTVQNVQFLKQRSKPILYRNYKHICLDWKDLRIYTSNILTIYEFLDVCYVTASNIVRDWLRALKSTKDTLNWMLGKPI